MQAQGGTLEQMNDDPDGYNSGSYTTMGNTTDNDPDLRASTGTPATEITSAIINKPDITIICAQCDLYVGLCMLTEHRQYHVALEVMKYEGSKRPESVAKLMQRRRTLLQQAKSRSPPGEPLSPEVVQKVNDAYEFLKAEMEETYEAFRRIRENLCMDVQAVALNSTVECIYAVGMCSTPNERWKNSMEDSRTLRDNFGGDRNKCYLGLYDGYHGSHAAETAASELHHALLFEMAKFDCQINWTLQLANAEHCLDDIEMSPRKCSNREKMKDEDRICEQGVCAINQVIKGYMEKVELLKKEKECLKNSEDTKKSSIEDKENEELSKREPSTKSGRRKKFRNAYCEQVSVAFKNAYKFTDSLLSWGKDEQSRVRWSGCSALACLIQNTNFKREEETNVEQPVADIQRENGSKTEEPRELGLIHLAQAGEVHAVLVRGNQPYRLTKDHSLNNPRERARIEKLGGMVSEGHRELRVNGVISSTHGLGNHGDVALKRCITSEPYTTVVPIDQYAQFLVLASRGVWEVFSPEEATQMLTQLLPYNQVSPPSRLSHSIRHLLAARHYMTSSQSVETSHVPASELRDRLPRYSSMTVDSVGLPDHFSQLDNNKVSTDASYHGNQMTENQDLKTEVGSRFEGFSDEESGNEDDGETVCDRGPSLVDSRLMLEPPSREEIHREFAKVLSERLVQAAMLAGAKDNITVLVVLLPGCGL